jgi:hypothetical protein
MVSKANISYPMLMAEESSVKVPLTSCVKKPNFSLCEKKNVTFSTVETREYPRTLGDNPSVKKGPAISLGWYKNGIIKKYQVDEYEKLRGPRRKKHFMLSSQARRHILHHEVGASAKEINEARKEAALIKLSRQENNRLRHCDDASLLFETFASVISMAAWTGGFDDFDVRKLIDQASRKIQLS